MPKRGNCSRGVIPVCCEHIIESVISIHRDGSGETDTRNAGNGSELILNLLLDARHVGIVGHIGI